MSASETVTIVTLEFLFITAGFMWLNLRLIRNRPRWERKRWERLLGRGSLSALPSLLITFALAALAGPHMDFIAALVTYGCLCTITAAYCTTISFVWKRRWRQRVSSLAAQ
jgi:hypothetical protein